MKFQDVPIQIINKFEACINENRFISRSISLQKSKNRKHTLHRFLTFHNSNF